MTTQQLLKLAGSIPVRQEHAIRSLGEITSTNLPQLMVLLKSLPVASRHQVMGNLLKDVITKEAIIDNMSNDVSSIENNLIFAQSISKSLIHKLPFNQMSPMLTKIRQDGFYSLSSDDLYGKWSACYNYFKERMIGNGHPLFNKLTDKEIETRIYHWWPSGIIREAIIQNAALCTDRSKYVNVDFDKFNPITVGEILVENADYIRTQLPENVTERKTFDATRVQIPM